MKIRTLIVDDESLARLRIRRLLEKESDIEVVGECSHGADAAAVILAAEPDLVFLDIQMPTKSGFEVLAEVEDRHLPTVIFVTAYDEFALKAFDAYALDYLLKPFDDKRFATALERARERIRKDREGDFHQRLEALLGGVQREGRSHLKRLAVRTGIRTIFVRTEEIDWIEAEGKYVRVHVGGRSHLLRDSMGRLEEVLDPESFCRIHRSSIVNVERIKEIASYSAGEYVVVLRDGTKLTSGRSYRTALLNLLGKES